MTLRLPCVLLLCAPLIPCPGQQPLPNSCLGVSLSIPTSFHKVYCTDGVALLKHNTLEIYVQVIEPGNGAHVRMMHGDVIPQSTTGVFGGAASKLSGEYARRDLFPGHSFWHALKDQSDDHFSVINGAWFDCSFPIYDPLCIPVYVNTHLSYPYRCNGVNISGGTEQAGLNDTLYMLQFNNDMSSLSLQTFHLPNGPVPDIENLGLSQNALVAKAPYPAPDEIDRAQFVGLANGIIYTLTAHEPQPYNSLHVMFEQFVGVGSPYLRLDGGGSTKLAVRTGLNNSMYLTCTDPLGVAPDCVRKIPQGIGVTSDDVEIRMNTSIQGLPSAVTSGSSQNAYVYVKNDRASPWNGTIRFQLYDGNEPMATLYETQKQVNGYSEVLVPGQFVVPCIPTGTYQLVLQYKTNGNDHYYLVEDHYFVAGQLSSVSYDNSIELGITNTLPPPVANAGANQTIPSGGSTTLAGSGGSTYSWSPTSSLSNPNIWNPVASPTVTTTYTLTVTNANGCTATDQVIITVTGTGGGGAPANDNPCNATALSVGSSCSYITGTNVNATGSSVPTPTTCAASSTSSNPSGNYQGGDVWYSAVVPASGQLIVQTQTQSSVTDLVMVAYTGTNCSSLVQLACNDDQLTGSNYMPRLHLTGLTVGQTIRFRVYDFGNNHFGNFGICAYNPGGGPSPGRDLISEIISVSDNTVEAGDNISVTYKVKNIGTLNVTNAFLAAVYLSTDPNYSSGSDELVDGSIEAYLSLNAGQEYIATNTVTIPNEPDGNYYLISYADAASAVGETNEANNFGYSPIQLGNLVPDGPNLEVDDVDVIPNTGLAPGQEVDIAVRLENTGTEDSDNCDVLVVFDLNDNHQYDAGVDPVLESIIFPALEPGEDDTRTRDVLLPTNIPSTGGYDIIAVADVNNECNETNESDQEGSEEVDIVTLTPAGPDLVPSLQWIELPPPSNVQVSSQDLCVTSGYDIFFQVTNIGNLDSPGGLGNVWTRVYISSDPVISGNDYIWAASFHSSGSWNVGQVRSYHDNDTFEGMSPGPAYMIIATDGNEVLPETNEANNIIAVPIYLTTCGIGLPDLTGTLDFYSPYSSALGNTISADVTVWNQGMAPAPPTRVGLYVSDDLQYDGSGGLGIQDNRLENLGYVNITDTLFPGDDVELTIMGTSQGLTSTGLKYLIMAIDDGSDINELDRSNNNITVPVEITSVACYYNHEWLQLDTPWVDYLGWTGFPLYMNTEEGCTWTLSESVPWATGFNAPDAGDGPWYMGISENPYPIPRAVQVQLNGSPLLSITQGPRPCALVGDSLLPHLTATITHSSCNQPNGTVQVSGTAYYLPLQYDWSTSQTTANIESLMPGTYDLTITDAAGCTLDTSFAITNTGSACTPVQLHANLEGPFNGTNMNDALRQAGLIPTTEPYTSLGMHAGSGGGEAVGVDRLAVVGDSAVVDWMLVELRSSIDPAIVLETRSALLLRNGAIVSTAGSPSLVFGYASGSFNLAVRHRNHLGVMTGAPVAFTGSLVTVDFRSTTTGTWGTEAQKTIGSVRAMWSGNTNGDDVLKYTGSGNDRDPILVRIGGVVPTNTVSGYFFEDCNLNGVVQYTGSLNDRDPILVNIGGVIPTNTRQQQLP